MTTSGSYTFTVTRDDLIREAVLNMGKLGSTGTLEPQEQLDVARKLNMIVKQWMGKKDYAPGLKMWSRARGDLFLSATKGIYLLGPSGDNWAAGVAAIANANFGTDQLIAKTLGGSAVLSLGVGSTSNFTAGDYLLIELDTGAIFTTAVLSINAGAGTVTALAVLPSSASATNFVWNYTTKGQRPLELVSAVLRDSDQNDTPLNYMTVETYEQLPTKTNPQYISDPTALYYESSLTNGTLYTDIGAAQDVTKQIHIVYLRPLQDFVNPLDTPDFPIEWAKPLSWQLTKDCCGMFNAPWSKDMQDSLDESLAIARHGDAEVSQMYFQCNADLP